MNLIIMKHCEIDVLLFFFKMRMFLILARAVWVLTILFGIFWNVKALRIILDVLENLLNRAGKH